MILFIRIPKNASTSLYESFGKHNLVNARQESFQSKLMLLPNWNKFSHPSHINLEQSVQFLGKEVLNYLIICCVRHPYERLVSAYHFGIKTELWRVYTDTEPDFKSFVKGFCERFKDENFAHGHTQTRWISYEGELKVDVILHFETLAEDFERLNKAYGFSFKLPHLNGTKHLGYEEYFNDELKELVYETYKEDFNNFGYEK